MKMETAKWGEFRVGDLFEIISGKGVTKNEVSDDDTLLPAIQSGEENFGRLGYLSEEYCKAKGYVYSLVPCLTVARSGSVGFVGIQDKCVVGDSAKLLLLKQPQSHNALLFLQACLTTLRRKYSYSDKVTNDKYAAEMICLPVTDAGQPDWAYMEEYMTGAMSGVRGTVDALRKVAKDRHPVCVEGWGEFRVGDLFEIEPCKGKNSTLLNDGDDIAYIAASKENNGFNKMVSLSGFEDWVSKGNCLQFIHIGDGAAGWVNYIADDFIGMAGKSSCAYNPHMNEYVGLFLAAVLCRKNSGTYSFKESWTGDKVRDTVIKLPITDDGDPDWLHMENYICNVMDRQEYVVQQLKGVL